MNSLILFQIITSGNYEHLKAQELNHVELMAEETVAFQLLISFISLINEILDDYVGSAGKRYQEQLIITLHRDQILRDLLEIFLK